MEIIKYVEFSKGHYVKLLKNIKDEYIIEIDYNGPNNFIKKQTPLKKILKDSKEEVLNVFKYLHNIEYDRYCADESGYATVYRDRSNDKEINTCGVWIKRIEKK